ncbi:helix-turn-helix domain-containing protein [uncultured Intestinimonas sp.]|jgi:transcriptional regulator with XRE-family HTH domain|nr:helix-turn-helix domain-containing protein [uncultured Intestinimonas sp.]
MKEKKPINLEIGKNVKQVRENAGLTQECLAELIGLGVKHLSAIECGAVGVSLATLKQLCVLLSVPADVILFGIESSNSEAERSAALQFLTDRLSHLPDADFWATKEILDKLLEVMARSR